MKTHDLRCVPSSPRNDRGTGDLSTSLSIHTVTAGSSALSDIRETRLERVEERVDETKCRLTCLEACIVQQTYECGPSGSKKSVSEALR